MLKNGVTPAGAPGRLATYFRQWVTLCQVTGSPGDEYFIQVTTDDGGGSITSRCGARHPATRPPRSTLPATPTWACMPTWVPTSSRSSTSCACRPRSKGHTLVLNFYDIGDAGNLPPPNQNTPVTGTLQVIPPADSNVGATFGNTCRWTGDSANGRDRLHAEHAGRTVGTTRRVARAHGLQGHQRERRARRLERAVEHGADPDPGQLLVQRQRPEGLLGHDQLPLQWDRERRDVVERVLLGDPVRLTQ